MTVSVVHESDAGWSVASTPALVVDDDATGVRDLPLSPMTARDVLIQVRAVGICRTDLYAVSGEIPTRQRSFVPGHEFAGVVATVGNAVTNVAVGMPVAVNPLRSCERCRDCQHGRFHECVSAELMGVDFDGACADYVAVPASAVHQIPEDLSFEAASFAEPVAAVLGVLKAGINSDHEGLIVGNNRISELTRRVLAAEGFRQVQMATLAESDDLPASRFDFVIETQATSEMLRAVIRLVRPRGTVILKSRQHQPVSLTLRDIIPKEPILRVVNYGPFDDAVRLLATGSVVVDDLVGERFSLARHSEAFAQAARCESRKTFFTFAD